MSAPTYFDLFKSVLHETYRQDQSPEAWGQAARDAAEALLPFAGFKVAPPGDEPHAQAPAAIPADNAPQVVQAPPATAAVATPGAHPLGPAFDGWDVAALTGILVRSQELALAKIHGATAEDLAPMEIELLIGVYALGTLWAEQSQGKRKG